LPHPSVALPPLLVESGVETGVSGSHRRSWSWGRACTDVTLQESQCVGAGLALGMGSQVVRVQIESPGWGSRLGSQQDQPTDVPD
jgi:hypothetical protein